MAREGRRIRELLSVQIATNKMLGIGKSTVKTENYETFIEMVDRSMTLTNLTNDEFDVGITDDRSMCYVKLKLTDFQFDLREHDGVQGAGAIAYLMDNCDRVEVRTLEDGKISMLFELYDVVRPVEEYR